MLVLRLTLQLRLHAADSLKEKRRVVRSVKERLRQRFHVAVAEVGSHDQYRIAEIGVAAVAAERRELDRLLGRITDFLDGDGRFDIVERDAEIS